MPTNTLEEIYTPPNSYPLSSLGFPNIRLGLQGAPGTGKTYSVLSTFPNVTVLDFDNKLGAFAGRSDIQVVPFFNPKFITDVLKVNNKKFCWGLGPMTLNDPKGPPNRRDALILWLQEHGDKFTKDQTLLLDSWTSVQHSFHEQQDREPQYTKEGKENDYAPWTEKIKYSGKLCKLLEGLNCHIVVTFHEMAERDPKTGELLDKLQPLMQGKFVAEIGGHFTDFFRMVPIPKFNRKGEQIRISAPPNGDYAIEKDVEFFWQIKQDDFVNAHSMLTKLDPKWKYIPATFESFKLYR